MFYTFEQANSYQEYPSVRKIYTNGQTIDSSFDLIENDKRVRGNKYSKMCYLKVTFLCIAHFLKGLLDQ
jgi:hypothetical protein